MVKAFNPESLEVRFRNIQQPLLNRFAAAREALPQNLQDKIRDLRVRISQSRTVLEKCQPADNLRPWLFNGYRRQRKSRAGRCCRES